MKNKLPVLEYSVAGTNRRKKTKWTFRFKTPENEILIESSINFGSKAEAERTFVSVIKSIATNSYKVEYAERPTTGSKPFRRMNGHCKLKRGRISPARLAW